MDVRALQGSRAVQGVDSGRDTRATAKAPSPIGLKMLHARARTRTRTRTRTHLLERDTPDFVHKTKHE